jgi:hypothetical protein
MAHQHGGRAAAPKRRLRRVVHTLGRAVIESSPVHDQPTYSDDAQERVNDELAQEIVDSEARLTAMVRTRADTLGRRMIDLERDVEHLKRGGQMGSSL